MSVKILDVEYDSPAQKVDIKPNETLISINGNEILDVLDYRFYQVDSNITMKIQDDNGSIRDVLINKDEYEEIGLVFETYLMDSEKKCRNKCVFCFIDQLPKGMRKSLYFKDDDSRLSFLFGNYITLTNLSERDIDRIIKMHISPVNISVHTTNPDLRVKMMNNKFAGKALLTLGRLSKAGIKMNCQIVSCPGINDGEELLRTFRDLEKFIPSIESIAIVPVGLTRYREGLFKLNSYDRVSAGEIIDIVEKFGNYCLNQYGSRIVYPSDEFYLKAEREIPDVEFYEDFLQIENGVGMIASMKDEFITALYNEKTIEINRKITIATGVSAYDFINQLSLMAENKFPGLRVNRKSIVNNFFGEEITVTGLITGKDLIEQLKEENLGEELLISSAMLRREGDLFLDGVSIEDAQNALNIKIKIVENDGYELLNSILGRRN